MASRLSSTNPMNVSESVGYGSMIKDSPSISKVSPIGHVKSNEIFKAAAVFIVFSSLVLIFAPRFFPKYTRDEKEEATPIHYKIHLIAFFVWTCCVVYYGHSLRNS